MCFNGVLSGFQGCLKEVEWVFEGSYQGVSRMFKRSFKGVSTKIERCSEKPLNEIQGRFKVSKRSSKGVLRDFLRKFQRYF